MKLLEVCDLKWYSVLEISKLWGHIQVRSYSELSFCATLIFQELKFGNER
jgi:hypothetical protein